MIYTTIHSINQFNSLYENKLKRPSCLPICLEDLCSGWTIDSLRQILSKLTQKSLIHLPLVYHNSQDLSNFSNKLLTLQEVFKLFDTRGLGRVDGMEIICTFVMISSGSLLRKIEVWFYVFSLGDDQKIGRDAFCFFLDCYCRGISKVLLTDSDTFYPRNCNLRLAAKEIELVATALFKSEERVTVSEFFSYLQGESGPLKALFLFPQELQKAQEVYRDVMTNRLKIIPMVKMLIYSLLLKIEYK